MESDPKPSSRETPNRRSMLSAFNPSGASKQLWRFVSSREKVTEQLKTLLWVVPITVVIWVYAEREQVVAPNVSGVPINLHIADNLTFEHLGVGENGPTVSLQLTGPQQALEKVRDSLTTNIPHGLTIDLGNAPLSNSEPINLLDHISLHDQEMFKSNGVSVMKITPESINVRVERKVRKPLPVLIPPEINTLAADTHFIPPTVTVSGPESLLRGDDCKVVADLTPDDVHKKPGSYTLPSIALKLAVPNSKLQIDPPHVRGDLVVRSADVPYTIPGMYIWVQAPVESILSKYDITLPTDTIDAVNVTGPADKIKLIEDKTFKYYAVLTITSEDTQTPTFHKTLTYVLPEGVTVLPADQQRQFECTLTRKPQ